MSEYIEREEILKKFPIDNYYTQTIKTMPTADVRPVVLCRDCKLCNKDKFTLPTIWCNVFKIAFPDDFYCGIGERKNDDMRNQEGDTP